MLSAQSMRVFCLTSKVGHNCTIHVVEEKVGCLAKVNILHKVDKIMIVLNDATGGSLDQESTAVDFKYIYNT
jgi:hypothetical protein